MYSHKKEQPKSLISLDCISSILSRHSRSTPTTITTKITPAEPIEVSYTMLDNVAREDTSATLQKIATVINVQLKLLDGTEIPFTPFNEFDNSCREDKVYLYGPSGSGKSRSIFEIIKSKVTMIDRIYIINPRTIIAGTESGRIDLYELIDRFTENDAVLWDNFPDDLLKKDIESGRKALEVISSKNVKNLLVALKPKYLESYRDIVTDIFELYEHNVKYDKAKIKNIVKTYGISIRFRDLFERYITKDLDKISKILWEKGPTPLTVFDYYKDLSIKESQRQQNQLKEEERNKQLDGILEAENLLVSTEYYEHQFRYISNNNERRSDAEFLYTLRLCYDIAQARTVKSVEELQKGIFNSVPPIEASRKLATWIYLSGQYYAMHDVARHSIKFNDHVRIQIMQYLTNNFLKMVGAKIEANNSEKQEKQKPSEQFLHSLCVFLGRNLNFMPRDSPDSFLPENIYSYIKKNAQLENAFGQGVGENFESLDEELQEIIMNRIDTEIEFSSGMGESLGRLYSVLDDDGKRQQLMKKIYSGFLFARYFGQSLGRIFKYLPEEIKRELFVHIEQNTQIADGIGMGIGYMFKSLDDGFQKEIFLRAQKNSSLSRGLGLGFGLRFLSMNSVEVSELFTKADKDPQFDFGLGMGLAALFVKYRYLLPADFFEHRIQRWGSEHTEFMNGFGFNSVMVGLDKVPNEVLALMEKDGELAYGTSIGFGMYFLYMPPQIQQSLLTQASQNIKLDLGLGAGMGFVFKHLSEEIQHGELFFGRGDKKSEYDAGLGFGIGFAWAYQKEDVIQEIYARISTNNGFAFGLGYGLGLNLKYLSKQTVEEIFRRADKNVEFDRGLGLGVGRTFRRLDEELANKVIARAVTNSSFAFGLGRGLGRIFRYLSEEMKKDLLCFDNNDAASSIPPSQISAEAAASFPSIAKNNSEFTKGFASGLGSYAVMMYIREEGFVKKVFQSAKENGEFSSGLSEGLGYSFRYLPAEFQKQIMSEVTNLKNSEFTKGMGIGLGRTFEYLPSDLKDGSLLNLVQKNVQFAFGYGIGVGRIFKYLSVQNRKDILARAAADSGFAKGLGIGLGSIFPYLPDDLQCEILVTHTEKNIQFAKGLGIGLGSIFPYLADRNSILKLAESNIQFGTGLGEGLARIFKYLDPTVTREVFARLRGNKKDSGFAKGVGTGLGTMLKYFDQLFIKEIIYAEAQNNNTNKRDFFVGLGMGVGSIFPYLSVTLADEAFKQIPNDSGYARALGFAIGHVYPSMSNEQRSIIMQQADDNNNNIEFAYGLGDGLGHSFPSLRSELQEEILNLGIPQKNSEFRKGLGFGLGYGFNHVDEIIQDELLVLTDEWESGFTTSMGHGICRIFPSLSFKLQQKILKYLQTHNKFADGFSLGLGYSFKYLDKDTQEQISNLIYTNTSMQKYLRGPSNTDATTPSVADDEMMLNYDDFPLPSSVTHSSSTESQPWSIGADAEQEVSFSGLRQHYCICYIDMMDSTKIASQLKENELFKYYALFLNATATIARNFGAKIIKNAGDCLIYYFPKTSDASNNPAILKDVLECGITLTVAHRAINAKLHVEKLPPVNYRISADYGLVEVAKSRSSQSDDLFGSAMNLCAKINSKAPANGMVVGNALYELVKSFEHYNFGKVGDQPGGKYQYPAYLVESKHKRTILNPFNRASE
jgi:class 3 adenylate cyclase